MQNEMILDNTSRNLRQSLDLWYAFRFGSGAMNSLRHDTGHGIRTAQV